MSGSAPHRRRATALHPADARRRRAEGRQWACRESYGKSMCGRGGEAASHSFILHATSRHPCSAAAEITIDCWRYWRRCYEAPLDGRCVGDDVINLVR
jgi:hypothetical protein